MSNSHLESFPSHPCQGSCHDLYLIAKAHPVQPDRAQPVKTPNQHSTFAISSSIPLPHTATHTGMWLSRGSFITVTQISSREQLYPAHSPAGLDKCKDISYWPPFMHKGWQEYKPQAAKLHSELSRLQHRDSHSSQAHESLGRHLNQQRTKTTICY